MNIGSIQHGRFIGGTVHFLEQIEKLGQIFIDPPIIYPISFLLVLEESFMGEKITTATHYVATRP